VVDKKTEEKKPSKELVKKNEEIFDMANSVAKAEPPKPKLVK
jgi:hypothetical protein